MMLAGGRVGESIVPAIPTATGHQGWADCMFTKSSFGFSQSLTIHANLADDPAAVGRSIVTVPLQPPTDEMFVRGTCRRVAAGGSRQRCDPDKGKSPAGKTETALPTMVATSVNAREGNQLTPPGASGRRREV